ncbi:hypothetical protein F4780DRAFT_758744 [Xylariomycetidae sp. FL0641]|nr:hypothetical protein F4780DRAFT_758744 [Xylariomycetidae sp. FL0641]
MEGVGLDRPAIKAWKWRNVGKEKPVNSLMEGFQGERAPGNLAIGTRWSTGPTRTRRITGEGISYLS